MTANSYIRKGFGDLIYVFGRSLHGLLGQGGCCRFEPTCSQYAREAFHSHRWDQALELIIARLVRCRPGAPWGVDPVPPPRSRES